MGQRLSYLLTGIGERVRRLRPGDLPGTSLVRSVKMSLPALYLASSADRNEHACAMQSNAYSILSASNRYIRIISRS